MLRHHFVCILQIIVQSRPAAHLVVSWPALLVAVAYLLYENDCACARGDSCKYREKLGETPALVNSCGRGGQTWAYAYLTRPEYLYL